MPESGQIRAGSTSPGIAVSSPARSILAGSGAFGEVQRLARQILDQQGLILVVPTGWEMGSGAASRLLDALEANPGAAFALGEAAVGPDLPAEIPLAIIRLDAETLIARPRDPGPLAIRASEAIRLGWPDFGPPDLVLDGAAGWALATSLAVRGGQGLFVPGAWVERVPEVPGSVDCLRPEGVAWLVANALGWGPTSRPPTPLAERLWRRWTNELAAAGYEGLTPPETQPR